MCLQQIKHLFMSRHPPLITVLLPGVALNDGMFEMWLTLNKKRHGYYKQRETTLRILKSHNKMVPK
jgi:hypothetical protein